MISLVVTLVVITMNDEYVREKSKRRETYLSEDRAAVSSVQASETLCRNNRTQQNYNNRNTENVNEISNFNSTAQDSITKVIVVQAAEFNPHPMKCFSLRFCKTNWKKNCIIITYFYNLFLSIWPLISTIFGDILKCHHKRQNIFDSLKLLGWDLVIGKTREVAGWY